MWFVACAAAAEPVHHALEVTVDPAARTVTVTDRLTPPDATESTFFLHQGLAPAVATKGWTLEPSAATPPAAGVPLEAWVLRKKKRRADAIVALTYGGPIDHAPAQVATEYQRSFATSPGVVGPDGVALSGASYWVPTFDPEALVTFDLTVRALPTGWEAVSQGERTAHEPTGTTWRATDPTEDVQLVAGPWREYDDRAVRADGTAVDVRAFLRSEDPALADKYLRATKQYLGLYEGLLPRYPYPSFALVENFWETGYGMPGFTLLGPEIVRFPFILTSSYPHELLHNWWGNSAYVAGGNWCEGLTAYLADHLFAEQRGEGAVYRRSSLQKYADFVGAGADFPLSQFGERDSAASEAVGYGKALMVFHMVRRSVGDEKFQAILGRFYEAARFRRASWDDFAAAVSAETGADWKPWFAAWTTRTGAPTLLLAGAAVTADGTRFALDVTVRQDQPEDVFPLTVPLAVTLEGQAEATWVSVPFTADREAAARFTFDRKPVRVDVDPAFDVMRRVDPLEVPPALSNLFGEGPETYVIPAGAPEAEQAAWKALATAWAKPSEPVVLTDAQPLPAGNVWVLGWSNRLLPAVAAKAGVALTPTAAHLGSDDVARKGNSVIGVARADGDPHGAVGFVAADPLDAVPGLIRKLPHYGRYSYLAFSGTEPQNTVKGMSAPAGSPLVRDLTAGPLPALSLPAREPMADLPSPFDAAAILKTATALSAPETQGRGLGSPGLEAATAQVEAGLKAAGLTPERRTFAWTGGEPSRELQLTNLVVTLPGTDPHAAPVLVTAHLDHLGAGWPNPHHGDEGKVHPGADDNASGVAVALELAKVLATEPARARSVIFAFTTGEEAGLVGSRHLVPSLDPKPFACLNLDTVGRRSGGPIQVLGADSAREWRFAFQGIGYTTGLQTTFAPGDLASSDQAACHEAGVPGVQLFTTPNADYHRPTDTADKLDGPGMADVAEVAHETLAWLAERTDPLTVQLSGAAPPAPTAGPRKASLGTMPDFTFPGPGVRVQEVTAGSPAAKAGIVAGDVLVALGSTKIADLKGFAEALAARQPGDAVEVRLSRDGKELVVKATLGTR